MTWYEIAIALATALGGIEFIKWLWDKIFNRKNNKRLETTKVTNAEIEVEKNKALAAVESKQAAEDAHAKQCHQYEERIADLHKSLDTVNGQLDYYIQRDIEKEKRFVEQTNLLREKQRALLNVEKEKAESEVKYLKRISELELELEKKRCDDLPCPFRQPPNAHTQSSAGQTKEEYFKHKGK